MNLTDSYSDHYKVVSFFTEKIVVNKKQLVFITLLHDLGVLKGVVKIDARCSQPVNTNS